MTPDHISDAVYEALADAGQVIVLRRNTLGPHGEQIPFDVSAVATVRGMASLRPFELIGTVAQIDNIVTLSNREIADRQWPGPPRTNDQVIVGDKTMMVTAADTLFVGGVAVKHTLRVRG